MGEALISPKVLLDRIAHLTQLTRFRLFSCWAGIKNLPLHKIVRLVGPPSRIVRKPEIR